MPKKYFLTLFYSLLILVGLFSSNLCSQSILSPSDSNQIRLGSFNIEKLGKLNPSQAKNAGTIPNGRGRVTNSNIWIVVGDTSFAVAGDHYSLPPQGVSEITDDYLPEMFDIFEPYPNPCYNSCHIRYELSKRAQVKLAVYNVLGQRVKMLVNGLQQRGNHRFNWDCYNESGQPIASSIYFCCLMAGNFVKIKKIMLIC
ncbi:MAG: FlgD immunoglobulin-like domain containing protein [Candidatus Edwardsbacteria bacterium]